ncbi:MAG: hypothetical protein ACJA2C_001138, partial [Marinoscillum sp.]
TLLEKDMLANESVGLGKTAVSHISPSWQYTLRSSSLLLKNIDEMKSK